MHVERFTLRLVEVELKREFVTSVGSERLRRAIILEVLGDGINGYGECVATSGPWYSHETVDTAWRIIADYIVPNVLGKNLERPEEFSQLVAGIRGHNMAKAAVEMALWDLYAKEQRVSISRALGGEKGAIESGVSLGLQEDLESLLDLVAEHVGLGYARVKLKIRPTRDVEIVREVRDRFPDVPLMVDGNGAYSVKRSAVFDALDELGLMMIEQPLSHDDLSQHAQLQSRLQTPVCLDESIPNLNRARDAVALNSCRIVNVKPGRMGGHSQARRIAEYLDSKGMAMWVGGMLETGIGRAHNVALASLGVFTLPNDISASERYYEHDLVEPPFELAGEGTISVPQEVGLGVEILGDELEKATTKSKTFAV